MDVKAIWMDVTRYLRISRHPDGDGMPSKKTNKDDEDSRLRLTGVVGVLGLNLDGESVGLVSWSFSAVPSNTMGVINLVWVYLAMATV